MIFFIKLAIVSRHRWPAILVQGGCTSSSVSHCRLPSGTTGYKLKQGLFDLGTVIEAISVLVFLTSS